MTTPDTTLLLRMRKGHEASARELWSRHAPRLTAYARAILAREDPGSAPDIVQSVFLAILQLSRADALSIDDPAGWLLRTTRNRALNRVRSLRRERARIALARPLTHTHVSSSATNADPWSLLEALPRPLREVVTLKHAADLTFDQMAIALGQNRSTIASRYRAAMAALRRLCSPNDHPTDATPRVEVLHARP